MIFLHVRLQHIFAHSKSMQTANVLVHCLILRLMYVFIGMSLAKLIGNYSSEKRRRFTIDGIIGILFNRFKVLIRKCCFKYISDDLCECQKNIVE